MKEQSQSETERVARVGSTELLGGAPPETPDSEAAGWWLTGWQRAWTRTTEFNYRIYAGMCLAEDRYQRTNKMGRHSYGGTEAVNGGPPNDAISDREGKAL